MIDIANWSAWFTGSGNNGWIYDSITVDWETKKNIKGKETVSVTWKNKTKNNSKEIKRTAWRTNLWTALKVCEGGFGWVTCAKGAPKNLNLLNGDKPQISFSAF